ncbi:DUF4381 domain-containing protein [Shimia abyssi]|uniref:Uncharacterized protein DUF4381 n=1 Tax=Shimia abyssi TaxID=1662395 RepID=A0A2P8FJU6_9RHOB|nr:DUF4381 domain-containing protein [Shimia abyssi]PSL21996.1 uncharacterized protein DUF4381 [Shimia abyssi]
MSDTPTNPTNLVDLIDSLTEVPDLAPVSLWPQTQGWIVLAALLLSGIAFGIRAAVHNYRANAYRRAALAELASVGDDPVQIATILKRAALAAYPRDRVAPLTGSDWLTFLNQTSNKERFSGSLGTALATAPYAVKPAQAPGLNALARQWLRTHKPERVS